MPDIIFEKKGKTAYIRINRPEKRNAINLAVRQGLCDAWKAADSDPNICSVILTGGEKIFSAGQDLVELSEFRTKELLADLPLNNIETFGAMMKKPVIAAISGGCYGAGFLLTLAAADIRIASGTASFAMPEVKVGVPPALGIPVLLAAHFPPAVVTELLLLGDTLTADDAFRCGYVNRVVAPEELLVTADTYADKINALSPLIVRNIKKVIKMVMAPDPGLTAFSDTVCMLGRHSRDYIEGPKAFIEKRKPRWEGR